MKIAAMKKRSRQQLTPRAMSKGYGNEDIAILCREFVPGEWHPATHADRSNVVKPEAHCSHSQATRKPRFSGPARAQAAKRREDMSEPEASAR